MDKEREEELKKQIQEGFNTIAGASGVLIASMDILRSAHMKDIYIDQYVGIIEMLCKDLKRLNMMPSRFDTDDSSSI